MHARTKAPLLLALALAATGCTLDDGTGFGRLSARLWSRFEGLQATSKRVTSDGWHRSDNGFELQLTTLRLTLHGASVATHAESGGGGDDCSFDPANPPAGCSGCHGGHCHCDGALKSYEELAGCAAGATVGGAVSLELKGPQDLLGSGTRTKTLACSPTCELERGDLSRLDLTIEDVEVTASLRDAASGAQPLGGQTLSVKASWEADAALSHSFAEHVKVDRDQPYLVELTILLEVAEELFDGLAWETLTRSGAAITIDASTNVAALKQLGDNLARSTLSASVTRGDE
jgi:hypothetical protein